MKIRAWVTVDVARFLVGIQWDVMRECGSCAWEYRNGYVRNPRDISYGLSSGAGYMALVPHMDAMVWNNITIRIYLVPCVPIRILISRRVPAIKPHVRGFGRTWKEGEDFIMDKL